MNTSLERWLDNKRLSPLRDFSQLQDSFDRLFNEFMNSKIANGMQDISFSPACDIAEADDHYALCFDMPGVKKENLSVEVSSDQLIVKAERRATGTKTENKKHLSEVYYGAYTRSFTMPGPIDENAINAKFENGVLNIKIPKTEAAKAKQIPVH